MKLLSSIALLFGMTIATYAADAENGLSMNGLGINGMTSNALSVNGLSGNGLTYNALTINGMTMNRMSFNALTINGSNPIGRAGVGNPLADLANARLAK